MRHLMTPAPKKPPRKAKAEGNVGAAAAAGIAGFRSKPKKDATGETYRGRHTCTDVQWTGTGPDRFVTFTLTADELAGAADNRLLYTDQDVQRGIVPGLPTPPPRELAVADGYPDSSRYIF